MQQEEYCSGILLDELWKYSALSHIFLPFSLSGYEMSGSGVGDAARWESRHLLQEVFNTEIQVYIEPEKNCTDPGKT